VNKRLYIGNLGYSATDKELEELFSSEGSVTYAKVIKSLDGKSKGFRIDKKIIDKAQKEAKKASLCTSAFIRQAVIEKVSYNNKLKELEERIVKL